MRSALPAIAIAAVGLGCYLPLADGTSGPSEEGLLSVVPGSVLVMPGGSTPLRAQLLSPDGSIADPQPSFQFVSRDPDTASVDASGRVIGVAIGATTIDVTDGAHGTTSVLVAVAASVPAGPVALTCVPSVIVVSAGNAVASNAILTDASGAPVAASVTFAIDDPRIASVDAAGVVTGVATGHAVLTAVAPSGMLLGACDVIVIDSGSRGGGRCEDVFVDECWPARTPYRFFDAGLSAPVRVMAGTFRVAGCGLPMGHFGSEQAPDAIEVDDPGVVALFGGRMQSLAPGRTRYRTIWHGVECGESDVSVSISFRGNWQMQCANGDRGVLSLGDGNGGVMSAVSIAGAGAPTLAWRYAHGTGQICTVDPEPMSCTDEASAGMGGRYVTVLGGGGGTCASGGGCTVSVSHCGGHGTGDGVLDNASQFHVGDCIYTRGGGAALDLGACQPPMGACSTTGTPCPGVQIRACATGDLGACWVEVSGQRFTCGQCPAGADPCVFSAAMYAQSLCP